MSDALPFQHSSSPRTGNLQKDEIEKHEGDGAHEEYFPEGAVENSLPTDHFLSSSTPAFENNNKKSLERQHCDDDGNDDHHFPFPQTSTSLSHHAHNPSESLPSEPSSLSSPPLLDSSVTNTSNPSHHHNIEELISRSPILKPQIRARMEKKIDTMANYSKFLASGMRYKFHDPFSQTSIAGDLGRTNRVGQSESKTCDVVYSTDFDFISRVADLLHTEEGTLQGSPLLPFPSHIMYSPCAAPAAAELYHELENENVPTSIEKVLLDLHFTPGESIHSAFQASQIWEARNNLRATANSDVVEVERETLASVLSRSTAKVSSTSH